MNRMKAKTLLIIGCLFMCGSCATLDSGPTRFEYSRLLMGVKARVVLYGTDEAEAQRAAREAFARIAELEAVMSHWRDDSEVSRLLARSGGGAHELSDDLYQVLTLCEDLARETRGAFDVTVAPVVALWREARESGRLPQPREVVAALRRVGWRRVELDHGARTVRFKRRGTGIDFSAIGKGHACEEAVRTLRAAGYGSCLVELGGDISVGDAPPHREAWLLSVGDDEDAVIALRNQSVATSGDLEQHVVIGGARYSHIVDPATGLGLTNRLQVTVVARSGAEADALASAVSVMGIDRGLAFIRKRQSTEALIVHDDGAGRIGIRTEGFPFVQDGSTAR